LLGDDDELDSLALDVLDNEAEEALDHELELELLLLTEDDEALDELEETLDVEDDVLIELLLAEDVLMLVEESLTSDIHKIHTRGCRGPGNCFRPV